MKTSLFFGSMLSNEQNGIQFRNIQVIRLQAPDMVVAFSEYDDKGDFVAVK